uniref:CUT domain-containing protein n=1 Tax=Parastrongyloides trichosuri TaxID=131310 RepID=A0A0N4ZWG8_PARTI
MVILVMDLTQDTKFNMGTSTVSGDSNRDGNDKLSCNYDMEVDKAPSNGSTNKIIECYDLTNSNENSSSSSNESMDKSDTNSGKSNDNEQKDINDSSFDGRKIINDRNDDCKNNGEKLSRASTIDVDEEESSSSEINNSISKKSQSILSNPESSSSYRSLSEYSGKGSTEDSVKSDNEKKVYSPENMIEYKKHIDDKMKQLYKLVDDFGKADKPFEEGKFFNFEEFNEKKKEYVNLFCDDLKIKVNDAYKELEDFNGHIENRSDALKVYKTEMLSQATYLKGELTKLEEYVEKIEKENSSNWQKANEKLEEFYEKASSSFKENKIDLKLSELKEIFQAYHNHRVETILKGDLEKRDESEKSDEGSKDDNKNSDKTPDSYRQRNIEFIRSITGRYGHCSTPSKAKKEKSVIRPLYKSVNTNQLQYVERQCDYTLQKVPDSIRDISRLDYTEHGFRGRLNIDTLCQEMRNYLLTHTISRYHFSQKVLGMSGGALNELLNKPRVFEELTEKGITSFLKIRVYLDIVKGKGPYEGKKLSPENIDSIKKLNKYFVANQ